MINPAIAHLLNEMADLLELSADNPFRIRAFRRAAQAVETFPVDLSTFSRDQCLEIPGIGKGIADIICEFQARGVSTEHAKLAKLFPKGVLEMMHVGGVGPKRAAQLFRTLKIDSLEKLEEAAKQGRLKMMDGFGEKLESKILKSIDHAKAGHKRLLVPHAHRLAASILRHLASLPDIKQPTLAGSARRWKETVGDLDFLCMSDHPDRAIKHFLKTPGINQELGAGDTKASVLLANGFQVDFRVVKPASFGAALLYFTGSKEHNVRLRELAIKKGYSLSEYGLFKISDKEQKKPIAGRSEEDVYKALGLAWVPPELREDRGEIEAAMKNELPDLVERADVRGDFHNHTVLSDGANTLEEMMEAARKQQWKWFFTGDHSMSLKIARGLSVADMRAKMERVKKLAKQQKGFQIFTSSEVDILKDGEMDYPDDVLDALDCVVASVHTRFNQPEPEMTARVCRALENPHVDILGHLTGRLIHKRDGYQLDIEKVLQTARKTQTAVEINGQPDRAELSDVHVKRAVELGVPLALNTDAHSTQELDHMELALHIARRGWAEKKDIINCLSADEIKGWLDS